MSDQLPQPSEASPPVASLLWYNSRSQIEDGRGFCQRSRYLTYHSGPNGYGITKRAQSIPLTSGSLGHDAGAGVMEWCRDHDEEILQALGLPEAQTGASTLLVPREVVRASIQVAYERYEKQIEARGFDYFKDSPETQYLVREQKALIAGLIWAWVIEVLPEILRHSKILEVELDRVIVYDCTCGLGAFIGTHEDHVSRSCQGKGLMNKPDFISQRRDSGELGYHEFKTTGSDGPSFRDKWEVMMQMITTTTEVEQRYGKPVSEIWVHGLIKGKREQGYNPDSGKKDFGPALQNSRACYGYVQPAAPPMERVEIRAAYEYWDEYEQRVKKVGKKFRKTPIWEIPIPVPDGWTIEEAWSEFIGSYERRKMLALVGPLIKQQGMVEGFFQEAQSEEDKWQAGVWELHDLAENLLLDKGDGSEFWQDAWAHPTFQQHLNTVFPRSYNCRRFGKRYACQHETTCFYKEGWEHPLTVSHEDPAPGPFVLRRPHHVSEMAQAMARGLLPPEDGLAEEAEEPTGW